MTVMWLGQEVSFQNGGVTWIQNKRRSLIQKTSLDAKSNFVHIGLFYTIDVMLFWCHLLHLSSSDHIYLCQRGYVIADIFFCLFIK